MHLNFQQYEFCCFFINHLPIKPTSATNLSNQAKFQESLNDLFDYAYQGAMSIIRIEEDQLFLLARREKGRKDIMSGVDKALVLKEERAMKRKLAAEKYALKVSSTAAATTLRLLPPVTISSQDEKFEDVQLNLSQLSDAEHEAGPSMPKSQKPQTVRGIVDVITPEVAVALDRTNNSDRKASHIFAAMGTAGHMKLVSWSLTSLFSTNMAISEMNGHSL